jgi:predicted aspartyl protease
MWARTDPDEVGTFSYPLRVYSPDGSRHEDITPLVDTGSLFTWVPAQVLDRLGVQPTKRYPFQTATGGTITRQAAEATVELDGDRATTIVVFGQPGDLTLLGAYTLEGFLLMPDTVYKRLVPIVAPVA